MMKNHPICTTLVVFCGILWYFVVFGGIWWYLVVFGRGGGGGIPYGK